MLTVILACAGTLAAATAASAAPGGVAAQTRWRLVDYRQTACFDANVHDTYYGIYIKGQWARPIDIGATGLPSGGSYTTSYAPIPPGSSSGEFTLAYVHVTLSTIPSVGKYQASIWANDGSTTRQVPVVLDVRTRCGY